MQKPLKLLPDVDAYDFLEALRKESPIFDYAEIVDRVEFPHRVTLPWTISEETLEGNDAVVDAAKVDLLPVIAMVAAPDLALLWEEGDMDGAPDFLGVMDGAKKRDVDVSDTTLLISDFRITEYREPNPKDETKLLYRCNVKMSLDLRINKENA